LLPTARAFVTTKLTRSVSASTSSMQTIAFPLIV
jgi:hypothetical protein